MGCFVVAELLGNPKGPAEEPAALQRKLTTPALAPLRFMEDTHTQYHATQTLVAPILLHFGFLHNTHTRAASCGPAFTATGFAFIAQSSSRAACRSTTRNWLKAAEVGLLLGFGEFRRLLYPV